MEIHKQNLVILSARRLVRLTATRLSPAPVRVLFSFFPANSLELKGQSEQCVNRSEQFPDENRQPTYSIGTVDRVQTAVRLLGVSQPTDWPTGEVNASLSPSAG